MRKTHKVIDTLSFNEECNSVFAGTKDECENFCELSFGYIVVPMTETEIEYYNDNQMNVEEVNTEKEMKLYIRTPLIGNEFKVCDEYTDEVIAIFFNVEDCQDYIKFILN